MGARLFKWRLQYLELKEILKYNFIPLNLGYFLFWSRN